MAPRSESLHHIDAWGYRSILLTPFRGGKVEIATKGFLGRGRPGRVATQGCSTLYTESVKQQWLTI